MWGLIIMNNKSLSKTLKFQNLLLKQPIPKPNKKLTRTLVIKKKENKNKT